MERFPAFGFRFDTEDGSVAFSGDTTVSDNLVRLAAGADVLVRESSTWTSWMAWCGRA